MSLEDYAEKNDTRLRRLEDDLRLARNAAAAANKRAAENERIRELVFGLKNDAPLQVPSWAGVGSSGTESSPHVAVLVTSDFQWGEVINKDNMDGLNAYDVAIATQRYQRLVDATLDLSMNHLPKNRYDGLVYLRLGDQVSGNIHQELRETNELSAIPAVRSLVGVESVGLRKLADAFGKVHVVSVPGNHGRVEIKPPSKRAADNFDTISSWWLESIFAGDPRLTWQTPNSIDATFKVYGRTYLATHGDRIGSRGGEGFIGPAATIMRGMKRTFDQYAKTGVALDKMFVGHFHTAYDLGYGWCNGSLPGYSEYARGGRMTPEPAVQWLLMFHPKWGETSAWKIRVDAEPKASAPRSVLA
jgi:hypothetical protein